MRLHNFDSPNQPEAKDTQFTLVPIPKRHANTFYPVISFKHAKSVCLSSRMENDFSFILKDGHWRFQLISIRATTRDFKAGAAPVSYFIT